ncbi:MAG TPA: DegT/DnrJ/EryC1/StrS family aminotransferase, partial [Candidatus Kapabacteria bacterium]|nr:DegT/DnrJ/EryC1/StrS family aminotransferase [Candidatus Kapabacteria bacterium]
GAYGDAGLIVTNDDALAATARSICNHGQGKTYYHDLIGVNSRLDSIQAAILRIKLRHMLEWNAARNKAAQLYDFHFSSTSIAPPYRAADCTHIFHQYSIRVPRRELVTAYLKEQGIPFMIYYPVPLHLQPAYKQYGGKVGDFPITEKVAQEIVSLPMHSELTEDQIAFIARTVIEATETVETPA